MQQIDQKNYQSFLLSTCYITSGKPHCTLGPALWERSWQIAVSTAEGSQVGVGVGAPVRKGWGNCIQSESLKGNPRVFFQYWDCQENVSVVSTVVHSSRVRSNRHMRKFWFKGEKRSLWQQWSIDKVAQRVVHSPFSEVFKTLLNKVLSNLIRRLKKQKVCVETSWVLPTWRILFYFYCFHGYSSVLLNTQGHRGIKDLWACWKNCWRISFWLQVTSTEVLNWSSPLLSREFFKLGCFFTFQGFFWHFTSLYTNV